MSCTHMLTQCYAKAKCTVHKTDKYAVMCTQALVFVLKVPQGQKQCLWPWVPSPQPWSRVLVLAYLQVLDKTTADMRAIHLMHMTHTGLRTRIISCRHLSMSQTLHSTSVLTTASKLPLSIITMSSTKPRCISPSWIRGKRPAFSTSLS